MNIGRKIVNLELRKVNNKVVRFGFGRIILSRFIVSRVIVDGCHVSRYNKFVCECILLVCRFNFHYKDLISKIQEYQVV